MPWGSTFHVRSVARRNAWGSQDDRHRTVDFSGGATASVAVALWSCDKVCKDACVHCPERQQNLHVDHA